MNKKPIVLTQDDTDKLIGANFVSRTGVRINGVDYQPVGGASILVTVGGMLSHTSSYVVSSNAIVSINGVPLRSGQLQLLVDVSQNKVHVTDLDLHRDVPFASGLTMAAGRTSLDLVNGGSLLATHIGLPDIFGGVTADATIRLTNPNGAELSNLAFHLGQFQLAGVGVDHADLTYSDSPLQLTGDAQVVLWPGGPTIAARLVLGGGTARTEGSSIETRGGGVRVVLVSHDVPRSSVPFVRAPSRSASRRSHPLGYRTQPRR